MVKVREAKGAAEHTRMRACIGSAPASKDGEQRSPCIIFRLGQHNTVCLSCRRYIPVYIYAPRSAP